MPGPVLNTQLQTANWQLSLMKRNHIQRSPSPAYKLDDEDGSYEPYVPVAQRRRQKLAKFSAEKQQQDDLDDNEDAQKEEELKKEKARMERTLLMEAQDVHSKKAVEGILFCPWLEF
jgi:ATP-dependent RNA helicase DDX41